MKDIKIIGGGPGDASYILPMARQAVEQSDLIIGDRRLLQTFGLAADNEYIFEMGRMMERLEWLKKRPDSLRVGILVSGDPLMYSMFRLVRRTFPKAKITVIPGIGSIQAFAARLGESMEDARIISAHGRDMTGDTLVKAVRQYPKLFILCDNERTPDWMAEQLMDAGLTAVDMAAGSRLSYSDENIVFGSPANIFHGPSVQGDNSENDGRANPGNRKYPALSLVMIKNPNVLSNTEGMSETKSMLKPSDGALLRDAAFSRNKTPMTREEIRWIAVGKMQLSENSVVWDVGAGTGSVSVECARRCPSGKVISIEKNQRALEVLYENRERLTQRNMEIIEGTAPEAFEGLLRPSHVFIGGAGGALREILERICQYGAGIRVIIACVTMETMMEAYKLSDTIAGLKRREMVSVRIETERPVGSYHLMEGGHPVTLIIAETCSGQEE